jgi:hypothetical protein
LLNEDSGLVAMNEAAYDSEDLLQGLLAKHPDLLAGDQINSDEPRRWLLVTREMAVPGEEDGAGRWSLDHLFLDQDAVPTLVEVKRSSDTRIRREVVGQMLDYAANAVAYWPVEEIRAAFEARCKRDREDPEAAMAELLGGDDEGKFWQDVKTNLQAGRVRMVFVADVVPAELRRVVEFLNEQTDPAEVLAIEVKQYVGQGQKTLVPRLLGQTEAAKQKKTTTTTRRQRITEEEFLADVAEARSPKELEAVKRLIAWAQIAGWQRSCNRGVRGSGCIPVVEVGGRKYYPVSIQSYGTVYLQMVYLRDRPPFNDEAMREKLHERIKGISDLRLTEVGMEGFPVIPLASLADPKELDRLIAALDWLVEQLRDVEA